MKRLMAVLLALILTCSTLLVLVACGEPEHTHVYSNFIAPVDPTCTTEGAVGHYECVDCHEKFDQNLPFSAQKVASIVAPKRGCFSP